MPFCNSARRHWRKAIRKTVDAIFTSIYITEASHMLNTIVSNLKNEIHNILNRKNIKSTQHMQPRNHKTALLYTFLTILTLIMVSNCNASILNKNFEALIKMNSLENNSGNYRNIQFTNKNIEFDAVILNKGYHAKLYQQKNMNQFTAQSIREVGQINNSTVAVNGGFYTTDFEPAGLFIENGKVVKKTARDPLLTSCVYINNNGTLFLEKKINNCLHATYAMQTGPLLIEQGNINPDLKALQNKLTHFKSYFEPHKRTIVAQSSNKKLLLIITSPITLFEAATILKNSPHIFGVDNITMALNLDGGSSTGMYIKSNKSYFYISEIKPVKTFLLIDRSTGSHMDTPRTQEIRSHF